MKLKMFLTIFAVSLIFSAPAMGEYDNEGNNQYQKNTERRNDNRVLGFAPAFAAYGSMIDTSNKPGYGAGGKIEMPIYDILKLEVRGSWLTDTETRKRNAKADIVPIDVGLALHLPGRVFDVFRENLIRPIALGGATWSYIDLNKGYGSSDDWGWYAGGGVEIGEEEGVGLLIEAIYRGIDVSYNGINDELNGVMGNVGLYYRW